MRLFQNSMNHSTLCMSNNDIATKPGVWFPTISHGTHFCCSTDAGCYNHTLGLILVAIWIMRLFQNSMNRSTLCMSNNDIATKPGVWWPKISHRTHFGCSSRAGCYNHTLGLILVAKWIMQLFQNSMNHSTLCMSNNDIATKPQECGGLKSLIEHIFVAQVVRVVITTLLG